jgi:transposase-like protein
MSPKKITDADKLEIVALYREGGETTASLANRFGVSNSTVSRLLKTTIPEAEYDRLIQRKRGAKVGHEPEILELLDEHEHEELAAPSVILGSIDLQVMADPVDAAEAASIDDIVTFPSTPTMTEDLNTNARRVRRRSSAPEENIHESIPDEQSAQTLVDLEVARKSIDSFVPSLPVPRSLAKEREFIELVDELYPIPQTSSRAPTPVLRNLDRSDFDYSPMPQGGGYTNETIDPIEAIEDMLDDEEVEADAEAVNALAEMFGEEIALGEEDEEEFDDEEELTAEEAATPYQKLDAERLLTGDRLHIRVTPLSQATLPRTCYIVIDKFAELIVRPLKDFADLGQIPGEEIQQRTLPIFDNHRVAKRFSNQRTQRVIKVPDSKVFHKTCHHLRMKGITRLLVDGSIYSLN